MKIKEIELNYILCNVPVLTCETGGLLGADISGIIVQTVLDRGIAANQNSKYSYYPNLQIFNNYIQVWAKMGICFAGIFHTHYSNKAVLSDEDINYIKKIFRSMPKEIDELYFPILLIPDKRFIPFLAERDENGKVKINEDLLEIVK